MADPVINDFIALAQTLGAHPARLAIWNEGALARRVSDARFIVTRRGANLAKLEPADIVHLDLEKMSALSASDTSAAAETIAEAKLNPNSPEPCADAALFAYLLGLENIRFVAHLHPIVVDQILASPRARQFADRRVMPNEILACGSAALLVPYSDPGLPLAKEVRRKMLLYLDRYKHIPQIIFVHNNGMFVPAANADDILKTVELSLKYAEIFVGASMLGGPVFLTPQNVTHIESTKEI